MYIHAIMKPIGRVHSCFDEKFGTPRQAGLAPHARAEVEIFSEFAMPEAWRGLETFSHVWILFGFHATAGHGWKPHVRPPRLGGNRRVGVLATRSNFRPNPIGMSAVRLEALTVGHDGVRLLISGADIIDGTPVLDIKPYLAYADSFPDSGGGFAERKPAAALSVELAPQARAFCEVRKTELPDLAALIVEVLEQDPRPAYQQQAAGGTREYGMTLHGMNVRWRVRGKTAEVFAIECPLCD